MTEPTMAHPTSRSSPARSPDAVPWATFAVCGAASYLATLDLSIVNVAFAEIARSFPAADRGAISWVITAYSILFGSLLVASGRMADRLGRKPLLQAGTALFAVGSIICAAAPGLGVLIAGRAVQGLGGALLTPASLGLLLAAFPPERRSQAIAWNGAVAALGVASGPTLGAFFVATLGWRSAFWINVPLCAAIVVAAHRSIRDRRAPAGPRPDVLAAPVLTAALAALVWAISRAETHGWTDRTVLGLAALAIALGAIVVLRTSRHRLPLLPPTLFRQRSFSTANLATVVFGAGFSANILNNVLFLRTVWRYGVIGAGLLSVLAPVVVAVFSVAAGRVMRRTGFRVLLIGGPLGFAAVTVAQWAVLEEARAPWTLWLPLMFLLGISIAASFPVLAAAAVQTLPPEHFALGGAINTTSRQIGAAIGVALVVTVQGSAGGIDGYRAGWLLVAACGVLAAAISVPRARPTRSTA
ncbi:MAG: MFS transporter [Acidimicrobiia bacterium]